MISVILIEAENAGNVGAIARSMANFGFTDLVLIDPICDITSDEATSRAMHGRDVLKNAKIADESALDDFDYLIGTTAKLGTDYNIPRSPLSPRKVAEKLAEIKGKKIGLVIGRESHGLSNVELKRCDFTCTIPAHMKYPTMNISHAVSIMLYEIFLAVGTGQIGTQIIPAGKKEKDHFLKELDAVLDGMDFTTEEKRDTQKLVWRKLLGKSMLTKRELFALFGFIKKLR